MKRVSKTVLLVFAILALLVGTIFMAFWAFILVINITTEAQFPGTIITQEGYIIYYSTLSVGIVFIIVSIIFFVVRAKKAD